MQGHDARSPQLQQRRQAAAELHGIFSSHWRLYCFARSRSRRSYHPCHRSMAQRRLPAPPTLFSHARTRVVGQGQSGLQSCTSCFAFRRRFELTLPTPDLNTALIFRTVCSLVGWFGFCLRTVFSISVRSVPNNLGMVFFLTTTSASPVSRSTASYRSTALCGQRLFESNGPSDWLVHLSTSPF